MSDLVETVARLEKSIDVWVDDLFMLRLAIEEGDPKSDVLVSINDVRREMLAALFPAQSVEATT